MGAIEGPDGVTYPSKTAAAAALGVHRTTVKRHLARFGNLRAVGAGWRRRVVHDGVCYFSIEDAAACLGFKSNTISYHLDRHGNLDRLGLGRAAHAFGKPGRPAHGRPVPFAFGPLRWASRSKAAAELGIARKTLRLWSRPTARPVDRQKLLRLVMQAQARREAAA